ncbi:hypothetical protein [Candidatus Terasakiella magnetica]|nr:hypothetical protein [Candidatus Terasakiella magnetica]
MLDDKDKDKDELRLVGNAYLKVIKESVCIPCVAEGNNHKPVDFDNVLECQCSCKKVEQTLEAARGLLEVAKE